MLTATEDGEEVVGGASPAGAAVPATTVPFTEVEVVGDRVVLVVDERVSVVVVAVLEAVVLKKSGGRVGKTNAAVVRVVVANPARSCRASNERKRGWRSGGNFFITRYAQKHTRVVNRKGQTHTHTHTTHNATHITQHSKHSTMHSTEKRTDSVLQISEPNHRRYSSLCCIL